MYILILVLSGTYLIFALSICYFYVTATPHVWSSLKILHKVLSKLFHIWCSQGRDYFQKSEQLAILNTVWHTAWILNIFEVISNLGLIVTGCMLNSSQQFFTHHRVFRNIFWLILNSAKNIPIYFILFLLLFQASWCNFNCDFTSIFLIFFSHPLFFSF